MSDWIEWDGGVFPRPHETMVMVRLRAGLEVGPLPAGSFHWGVQNASSDIIAYLAVEEKKPEAPAATLATDAAERKAVPIYSGVLKYFPRALAAVAECSKKGNDQHNPGKPLHWDRSKSGDELDALTRHLVEAGTIDSDGVRHSTKVAWRALANLEKELEREASA